METSETMKRFSVGDLVICDDGLVARYNQLFLIIQRFTETLVRIQCVRTGNKDIVNVDWLREPLCTSTK